MAFVKHITLRIKWAYWSLRFGELLLVPLTNEGTLVASCYYVNRRGRVVGFWSDWQFEPSLPYRGQIGVRVRVFDHSRDRLFMGKPASVLRRRPNLPGSRRVKS